jgi:hypothetical protein
MRYVKIVLGFVLWLLNAAQSQAWGPLGHEIVAEIAAQSLKPNSPPSSRTTLRRSGWACYAAMV